MRPSVDWRLCFVADAGTAAGRDLAPIVEKAVRGGATIVQLRAKSLGAREFLDAAKKLAGQLKRSRIPFIVNDRVDIALACGADGIHLGRDDMPYAEARRLMGRERLVGLSAATAEEAEEAERLGADYIGVWPVFPTSTKETGRPPLGCDGLKAIRSRVGIAILAIGGISTENAADVIAAGADGVAVVSAILSAPDPERAAAALIAAVGPRRT
ncbi:MAG: thiamine phosphate synthase [Candidatus Aminicenantes bacterium]|nr:thiamine phosphate synthase [Candidatus Aminicenantes bacterium]